MRRGFSLLEMVLSCTLLSGLFVTAFLLMGMGFRGFRTSSNRMDTHSEMQSIVSRLRQDVESSTSTGVQIQSRSALASLDGVAVNCKRFLLCLTGVFDWRRPESFDDQSGMPLWDRYFLYHADTRTGAGGFYRCELKPPDTYAGGRWLGFSGYASAYPNGPPGPGTGLSGASLVSVRRLSPHLLSFDVVKSPRDLIVDLRLVSKNRLESIERDEVLQVRLQLIPRNRAQ